MQPMIISDLSSYIPETKATVSEIAELIKGKGVEFTRKEVKDFSENLGFCNIAIEHELTLEEMIYKACVPTVTKLINNDKSIDRIIFVRTSQVYWHRRNIFKKLLHDFGLEHVPVFSIEQHNCATIHVAFHLIHQMLNLNSKINGVLLVAGDKAFHPTLRKIPYSLLGDSASCGYLSISNEYGHKISNVRNSADAITYKGVQSSQSELEWFNTTYYFAIRQLIKKLLNDRSITLEQIQLILGTNANYRTWDSIARVMNITRNKLFTTTISKVGHLYCSDVMYNIQQAVKEKVLNPGDNYLSVTVGLGGTYGCAFHQYFKEETA